MFSECKLFRDIALQRNISRAAAANGLSQSAATQQVQELERRIGLELLDRSTRPLNLTQAGKLYLDFCRDVIRRAEQLEVAVDQIRGEAPAGELRIASIYSVALTEMTRVRDSFAARCPEVDLRVEYLRPDKVYDAVANETADLGLVSYPESSREIAVVPWRDETMAVALYPDHPLAGRDSLSTGDLDGEDFVAFDPDLSIRKDLDRWFREHDVRVRIAMHFDNIQMVKEAVALCHGISVLPERTMEIETEQGRLVSVRLKAPGLVRPVGIIHRKRKRLSRAARAFMDTLVGQAALRS